MSSVDRAAPAASPPLHSKLPLRLPPSLPNATNEPERRSAPIVTVPIADSLTPDGSSTRTSASYTPGDVTGIGGEHRDGHDLPVGIGHQHRIRPERRPHARARGEAPEHVGFVERGRIELAGQIGTDASNRHPPIELDRDVDPQRRLELPATVPIVRSSSDVSPGPEPALTSTAAAGSAAIGRIGRIGRIGWRRNRNSRRAPRCRRLPTPTSRCDACREP